MYYVYVRIFILFLSILISNITNAHRYQDNGDKEVFFITPSNGETVSSPVKIKFGVRGMNIVPAGIDEPESGHHHLLINVDKLPSMNQPIPSDENHLHFGSGQTETELTMPKDKYTLQLLLGNHLHIPHDEPLISEKIQITVK